MNKSPEERRGKLLEQRKQSRVGSENFLKGKPTEAYPYPIENLGYTSTFKQKEKRKTLVRQENIKNNKTTKKQKYTFRNMIFIFKRKPNCRPYH